MPDVQSVLFKRLHKVYKPAQQQFDWSARNDKSSVD